MVVGHLIDQSLELRPIGLVSTPDDWTKFKQCDHQQTGPHELIRILHKQRFTGASVAAYEPQFAAQSVSKLQKHV